MTTLKKAKMIHYSMIAFAIICIVIAIVMAVCAPSQITIVMPSWCAILALFLGYPQTKRLMKDAPVMVH